MAGFSRGRLAWAAAVQLVVARTLHVATPNGASLVLEAAPHSTSEKSLTQFRLSSVPAATTYANTLEACQACVTHFPTREVADPDASGHAKGQEWARGCRAGPCTARDGPLPAGAHPALQGDTFCISLDPIPWYSACEAVLASAMTSVYDLTRYCSYKEQIYVPPPPGMHSAFAGTTSAFTRLDSSHEQCLSTIRVQGAALWDDLTFCDSDLHALSACCESVHEAMKCTHEVGGSAPLYILQSDQEGFAALKIATSEATQIFDAYCVPLCRHSKEEFCVEYPRADSCVSYDKCSTCTRGGGEWCPGADTCGCPSKSSLCPSGPLRSPAQCFQSQQQERRRQQLRPTTAPPVLKPNVSHPPPEEPKCKYLDMVDVWSQK